MTKLQPFSHNPHYPDPTDITTEAIHRIRNYQTLDSPTAADLYALGSSLHFFAQQLKAAARKAGRIEHYPTNHPLSSS